jgi:serine/threonine-protein kinase RsbW
MGENQGGATKAVETLLDSTLESVDEAETLVLEVAQELQFPDEDLHKLGMAVREAMVNAVVHGNRYNLKKKVHLSIEKRPDRLDVSIIDEGEGFDQGNLPDPLAEENLLRQSGRGLLLIRAFVDEVHLGNAPPLGTEIRLTKFRSSK